MSSKKKRSRSSVFDTIQELDSQDVRASRKRKTSSTRNVSKSKAAQSQTKIHGHLMECRILLQRAMTGESSDDTIEQCNTLLKRLLEARRIMLTGKQQQQDDKDYRQIVESDELPSVLQEEYEECREEWKQVLDKRHKDLRLHAGLSNKTKFRVMDSSFWQQVEATVSHEELRAQSTSDTPVFDDSKVYQHMLQDFVLSSATAGGAEEAAAQRLGRAVKAGDSSKKKDVDRRASKGRKIRYVEVPKLVNFTFPVARPNSSTGAMDEDEFFRSLFGGAIRE